MSKLVTIGKWQYLRVTREHKCPVCGKPDWCLLSTDGTRAICQRVHDGGVRAYANAGTLHILSDDYQARPPVRMPKQQTFSPPRDWYALQRQAEAGLDPTAAKLLGQALGVSVESLIRFGLGRVGVDWSFPMFNARGQITGMRLRTPAGRKFAVKGSRAGMFLPRGPRTAWSMLICEGTTDAAAMLDAECNVLGRHACRGQVAMITEYVKGRDVVIVADPGAPGQEGAVQLAEALHSVCPRVRLFTPPRGKDAREWWHHTTPQGVRDAINAASEVFVPDVERKAALVVLNEVLGVT